MAIYTTFIISKNGGLIYHLDHTIVETEVEKTFSYPLDLKLDYINQRIVVTFGQRDGIKVGFSLLAINGEPVNCRKLGDKDIIDDILANEENFPISIKFGIPRFTANEKIVLASMFHTMYAIAAVQIYSNRNKDDDKDKTFRTGIEVLETDNFRLNCFQTLTGVKFVVVSDQSSSSNKDILLRKIYELYTDYALKNPFYSLDMPIRCELFDSNLQLLLEQNERNVLTI